MHVERRAVFLGAIREHLESGVRAPMQIGRRELDLDALLLVVLRMKMLEEADRVLARELEAAIVLGEERPNIVGHALQELLVRLVDEMVLVAQGEAIRDPHADILVGADDPLRALLDLRQLARRPAMEVLDRGDAGRDHLEGGVERVEIDVEIAGHETRREPQLERHVGRAELDRRQPDMMVAVDEAGQQHLLAAADHRRVRVGAAQLREAADRGDDAILLQYRAVIDLLAAMTIESARDEMLAADDRG